MQRIAVIGCTGSGKTHLATKLARALEIPVVHLDHIFWKPDWIPTSEDDFADAQRALVETPAWIIEGNYNVSIDIRLNSADTILWFDLSTIQCVRGTLSRWGPNSAKYDWPDGCEPNVSIKLLWYIIRFRRTRRPRIMEKLKVLRGHKRIEIFRSRAEAEAFVSACT